MTAGRRPGGRGEQDIEAPPGSEQDAGRDHPDVAPPPGGGPADPEDPDDLGRPGPPISRRSPFYLGFVGGLGVLLAMFLGRQLETVGSILTLLLVSLFLAAGLNPVVTWLIRRGVRRSWSVLIVVVVVLVAIVLFLVAIVPVITDQVTAISAHAPGWFDRLQKNAEISKLNDQYDILTKIQDYVTKGGFAQTAFGGVLGFGLAVLSFLGNAFIVIVLTLYFLSSLPTTTAAVYRLAPASRRDRVSRLGNRVLRNIGGYVSGAFVVALCAGLSTLVFLLVAGLGQYAVALAFVVALLDVIPMIGATIGAVIVCAIGFATDPGVGLACVVFYVLYQQLENYVIYPRVMSRSVNVPGVVTVIAALVGAALLGVIGALLAIPTAAAVLLIVNEVWIPRQETR